MATMAEVALQAGVSTATVSHVLNGTRAVAPETEARVRHAIDAVGYRLDPIARALRTSRTQSIGVVVSDTGHPIFADMIRGIDELATASGLTMLLAHSNESAEREAAAIDLLRERRVDGFLIVPATTGGHDAVAALATDEIPVVVIDRPFDLPIDMVASDAAPSLERLARHLVDHGHRRIGLVVGTTQNDANVERLEACRRALTELGIDAANQLVIEAAGDDAVAAPVAATRVAVADILHSDDRPSALISLNAQMTVAVLEAAAEGGMRIPEDLALVALDDLPWSQVIEPKITCAAQPAIEIGRRAMELLLRRIAEPQAPPVTDLLACELHHRRSCGCTDDLTIPLA